MLRDNITRSVQEIPEDMLFSSVVHAVRTMQYMVHKNGGEIEPDLNVLNKC